MHFELDLLRGEYLIIIITKQVLGDNDQRRYSGQSRIPRITKLNSYSKVCNQHGEL